MQTLQICPHPSVETEWTHDLLTSLISAMSAPDFDIAANKTALQEASLVNLWFFLRFIASFSGPYSELTETLHVDMCNIRQNMLQPGYRGAVFIPRSMFKCRAKGSLIPTSKGIKKIEDIQIGDILYGINKNNKLQEVSVVNTHTAKSYLYKVTLQSGRIAEVGQGHKFLTTSGYKAIEDIQQGESLIIAEKVPYPTKSYISADMDWLMGFIYGDGGVTGGEIRITIGDEDKDLVTIIKNIWPYKIHSRGYLGYALLKGMQWYLTNGGKIEKAIYKTMPPEYEGSAKFLSGLFDADGSVTDNIISFTTASDKLVLDVQRNLMYFGITSQYTKVKTYSEHGRAYILRITDEISIQRFKSKINFRGNRKKKLLKKHKPVINRHYRVIPNNIKKLFKGIVTTQSWKKSGKPQLDSKYNFTRSKIEKFLNYPETAKIAAKVLNNDILIDKVISITPIGEGIIVPIEVDGPHSYIDATGIVDHNSTIMTHGAGAWEIIRNPDIRIGIVSAKVELSEMFMQAIQRIFDSNPLIEFLFPDFIPSKNEKGEVQKHKGWTSSITICPARTKSMPEPTIKPIGAGGNTQGNHFDLLLGDDLVGESQLDSGHLVSAEMVKIGNWFNSNSETLLISPKESRVILSATRYAIEDAYAFIFEDIKEKLGYWEGLPYNIKKGDEFNPQGQWSIYYRQAVEYGEPIFPEKVDLAFLSRIRERNPWMYFTQYLNNPFAASASEFKDYTLKQCELDFNARQGYFITHFKSGNYQTIPLSSCEVIIGVDPAASEKRISKNTSRSAIVVQARSPDDNLYYIDCKVGYMSPTELLDNMFVLYNRYRDYVESTNVEMGGPFKLLKGFIDDYQERKNTYIGLRKINPLPDKDAKLRNFIQPLLAREAVYVTPVVRPYLEEELQMFPGGSLKDTLDAMEIAFRGSMRPEPQEAIEEFERQGTQNRENCNKISGY